MNWIDPSTADHYQNGSDEQCWCFCCPWKAKRRLLITQKNEAERSNHRNRFITFPNYFASLNGQSVCDCLVRPRKVRKSTIRKVVVSLLACPWPSVISILPTISHLPTTSNANLEVAPRKWSNLFLLYFSCCLLTANWQAAQHTTLLKSRMITFREEDWK